ncbi:MAG TPA: DUF3793 family protein [Geobacteraceae bacterium]|nr:DUF3793 family protein [Geobacteraceae bacterium]
MQNMARVKTSPPSWRTLSARFTDERDCLASFLALESAEIIAGIKPGNLVNVTNRLRPCGRTPYLLWHAHGAELLAETGLEGLVLRDRGDSLLLYLYKPALLQELLLRTPVATILRHCHYPEPADLTATLAQLKERLTDATFPHEIGIFLGYPLKDVLAFMGRIRLPFACQGPWKVYGKPEQSLELADRYRHCRCRMAMRLQECADPVACLREAA